MTYNLDDYSDFWTTQLQEYQLMLFTYNGKDTYSIRHKITGTGLVLEDEFDLTLTEQVVQKMLEHGVEVVDIRKVDSS